MENNDFVLIILQVCAHVITRDGGGGFTVRWGPFSTVAALVFGAKSVGGVFGDVQIL